MSYLDIRLQAQDKLVYSLRDFAGKKVILFFYPKDMTEGCTIEARDFTRFKEDFAKKGYTIIGVSRDSVESHCKFVEKEELEILLLSDVNEELVNAFEVLKQKNMYGKMVMGIERSTFILDEKGKIVQELRKVSAIGHVQSLLESL
ncbi:MAG: peroxiredoxin [Candidatus Izemoplasmatales bacterium]|nr:peroxiredoxin [bacterium]MDZ4197399.1 peroxiredoxin [Candidatus Izemoplasmatales bacterium]